MGIERSPYLSQNYKYGVGNDGTQHKSASGMSEEAKQTQQDAINNVKNVVTAPFDFLKWALGNWQLLVIAGAAIFLLIKD